MLARYYRVLFPLGPKQAAFFESLTAAGLPAAVMDVGAGAGEQLAWFAARGIPSVGLEPDPDLLAVIENRDWEGRRPVLAAAAMEDLPGHWAGSADLLLCLGNTLPHLPDRAALARALAGMRATLRPGGRLAVQTVNFDRVLADRRADFPVIRRELPGGGSIVLERSYDLSAIPGRVLFNLALTAGGETSAASWPLRPIRRDELVDALSAAGFAAVETFGDYDRSPFTDRSPALVAVARRTN